MSAFYSVIHEFDNLISKYDFKSPKKLWYRSLVALSKQLDDIFYCYVIARVHEHDGSLETNLWVGPLDRPDDGLDKLSAHIKVHIGYNQTLKEEFFSECDRKIIHLIEAGTLDSLVRASKTELETPSMPNPRYDVYTCYFLPFFQMVRIKSNDDKKTLGNKKKCQVLIEEVFNTVDGDIKLFFNKLGLKATIDKIWEFCYLYSL